MFACALQPGDEKHLDNIRKEAEYNVKRLRNHASLALWCGNNENLIAWHNWGWKDNYSDEVNDFLWATYERIFYEILPAAVEKYDPERSYWPSSPQSYGDVLPDRTSGDEHDWSVWFGQEDFENYGKNVPRFVSEYGLQSFPPMSTVDYFAAGYELSIFSDILDHRQRSNMNWIEPGFNGNDMQLEYIRKYFPEPQNFEHFVYLSQLSHQLATREAIEAHRRNMPYCMGSLYWQLNDCWPTMSWATVDYFGNWKAPHYEVKRGFRGTILSHEIEGDNIRIFGITDSLESQELSLQFYEVDIHGRIQSNPRSKKVVLMANGSTVIHRYSLSGSYLKKAPSDAFLAVSLFCGNTLIDEALISLVRPRDQTSVKQELLIEGVKTGKGLELSITANKPMRYVQLFTPGIKGHFSDNYFDLLPGSTKNLIFFPDNEVSIDPGVIDYNYLGNFSNLP
jgi:beta-mannosidase